LRECTLVKQNSVSQGLTANDILPLVGRLLGGKWSKEKADVVE
jgi:hypothetical protein